jgi:hypothetical protein
MSRLSFPALCLGLSAFAFMTTPAAAASPAGGGPGGLKVSHIAGQAAGGLLGGALGAGAGFLVGAAAGSAFGSKEGDGFWVSPAYVGGLYGAYGGYVLGSVGGIAWTGRRQGLQGSTWAALLGNAAGQGLAFWLKEHVGGNATAQVALVAGMPYALGLAAYDGSHWARTREGSDPSADAGPRGMTPADLPYRFELARITF